MNVSKQHSPPRHQPHLAVRNLAGAPAWQPHRCRAHRCRTRSIELLLACTCTLSRLRNHALQLQARGKIEKMSAEVVDSNPYSRLMALQRMGIVEDYEKIREKTVRHQNCPAGL
jgi:hypothetical protein